eukprot:1392208-Amorphochlora_amoeboformis.AAC.1
MSPLGIALTFAALASAQSDSCRSKHNDQREDISYFFPPLYYVFGEGFRRSNGVIPCRNYPPDSCDEDTACTWCEAGAVPSACFEKRNAKKLPSGVFKCDSSSGEESTRRESMYSDPVDL